MHRMLPGGKDGRWLPRRDMEDPVRDERRDDAQAANTVREAEGPADLLARWNTQAPHLTALEALERFGWSVFPLDQGKSPPALGGLRPDGTPTRLAWRAYQNQRVSKDTLLAWAQRFAPAAWAVITGACSGIIVLDFDDGEGARLLKHLGLSPHVRTGSGGYHVYFAHPGWPVKTFYGKAALGQRWAGLDIRADGGYAAFCGRDARGNYVWLREPVLEPLDRLPADMRRFVGLLHAPAPLQGDPAVPLYPAPVPPYPEPRVDLDTVLDAYRKDEWGDALLFAHLFAGRCVFDHLERAWYLWQGHFWKRDEIGRVRQLVSGPLASVYLQAAAELTARLGEHESGDAARLEQGAGQREKDPLQKLITGLTGRALALRTLARNSHVLAFACTDGRLAFTSDRWDTDPWLLGTPDGVLDLRAGELRDGEPGDYIRTIVPTLWQGSEAPAPRFERFLQEIFGDRNEGERAALITFLQRTLGYGITGQVSEHIFLLLFGEEGRNGKDTLMSVLQAVLGRVVGAVSNDVILSSGRASTPGAAKPHLCTLQGKRIAWASETDRGARFDIGQVKFLTGGGAITARQLYGKEYTFDPCHLLFLLTNNRPHADARDKAFWERLCPVTFRLRFVDHPTGPLERWRDRDLGTALQAEASGILAWLVRGCLDWQRHGLHIPDSVLRERAAYREEEDTHQHFVGECCTLAPEARVQSARLFERYKQWADDNNIGKKLSGTAFGIEMKRLFQQGRNSQGTYYRGIGLLHPGG